MEFWLTNGWLIGLFVVMMLEVVLPIRQADFAHDLSGRWLSNGLLLAASMLLFRIIPVSATLGVLAFVPDTWRWLDMGEWPVWVQLTVAVLILDLLVYWIHRASHRLPMLWRLHRVHHSDMAMDFSTSVRHHPFESMLVFTIISVAVVSLGITAQGYIFYKIVEGFVAPLTHGNIRIPNSIDRWLRKVIMVPSIHWIHHSTWQPETDSNYGIIFPWWDKLFGTYRDRPRQPYEEMCLGLDEFCSAQDQRIDGLLLNPFTTVKRALPESAKQ